MDSKASPRPTILFALLDWGMGHASRTAPLIQYSINQGWDVHIGTKGTALAFLKSQFEGVPIAFHNKPGAEIKYAKRGTLLKIAGQMPRFLKSIAAEMDWTRTIVESYGITHIISDNCYGAHHPKIPSVLISHQLQLPVPIGLKALARFFVKRHTKHFREVWIPDDGKIRLSGKLGFQNYLKHARCIGVLTRLPVDAPPGSWKKIGMVSGPEPHRKLMETALMAWLQESDEPALLIAGRPGASQHVDGNVTVWPDPTSEELASALKGADIIVCRSGYSSLLDLAALGKRAILIPTPGQPEQVYLAKHWAKTFGMTICTQKQLEAGQLPAAAGTAPLLQANAGAFITLDKLVASA